MHKKIKEIFYIRLGYDCDTIGRLFYIYVVTDKCLYNFIIFLISKKLRPREIMRWALEWINPLLKRKRESVIVVVLCIYSFG